MNPEKKTEYMARVGFWGSTREDLMSLAGQTNTEVYLNHLVELSDLFVRRMSLIKMAGGSGITNQKEWNEITIAMIEMIEP